MSRACPFFDVEDEGRVAGEGKSKGWLLRVGSLPPLHASTVCDSFRKFKLRISKICI